MTESILNGGPVNRVVRVTGGLAQGEKHWLARKIGTGATPRSPTISWVRQTEMTPWQASKRGSLGRA